MTRQKHEQPHEEIVDRFIEDLLQEKKPRVYNEKSTPGENADVQELEKIFETARAVKRLRRSNKKGHIRQRGWVQKTAAVAAVLLLMLGAGLLRTMIMPESNMVEAVVKAYEELQSYTGIVEIRGERNDTVEFKETIQISYKKPFKYKAVHHYNEYEKRYQSDGQRLAIIDANSVTIDNLFPEKELWRYHLGTTIYELEAAAEIKMLGTETLFGREATVLEYRYRGDTEAHYIWIDSATNLPLRKVLNHPEGTRLVVEFQEIKINPALEAGTFVLELPGELPVVNLNQNLSLEQVQEVWPLSSRVTELLPEELGLWQAGKLEDMHFYDYVLRFQGKTENDFLDVFYTETPLEPFYFRGNRLGRLDGGIVEFNPTVRNLFETYTGDSSIARWMMEDEKEIFIVSSRNQGELEVLLEKLAGEQISFVEASELMREEM